MAPRTNPLAGRYFNSPALAQIGSNLASAFSPISPEEFYAAEKYKGLKNENARLSDLWASAGDDFDKKGVAVGQWNPSQSYYAVDTADATTRRGQDMAAETSRVNNLQTNRFNLAGELATNNLEYDEAMPGLSAEVAAALGFPVAIPSATGAQLGAPRPRITETEARGALVQQGGAGLSDEQMLALAFGDTPIEKVVTSEGPRFSTRLGAIGQEPYVNAGSTAAAQLYAYRAPDGREGSAVFDPSTGALVDAATRAPLPEGTTTAKLEGGSKSDAFGATTSNVTEANKTVAEVNYGLSRSAEFRALLENNPGILGVPGMVRGFAQDVAQAAIDMGGAFGSDGVLRSVEDVRRLAQEVAGKNGYDPAFAQASALALEMAYLDAKMQDPSGEVNVRELERLLGVYDGGIAGNERVIAALDVLDGKLASRRDIFASQLRNPGGSPAPAAGPVQITSDAEYNALPSGTRFLAPDGTERVKP